MKKSYLCAIAVTARASAPKLRPMSGTSASTHKDRAEFDRPRSHTTARIAAPESTLFDAAQASSASTTSSRSTGAFMIASQVRCTCMREKAEYIASKVALFMVLEHTTPAARNAMEDTPPTCGSIEPSP